MKVFELAKELDTKALDLIEKIRPLNFAVKNHMSDLSDDQVVKIREFITQSSAPAEAPTKTATVSKRKAPGDGAAKAVSRSSVVIKRKKDAEETSKGEGEAESAKVQAGGESEGVVGDQGTVASPLDNEERALPSETSAPGRMLTSASAESPAPSEAVAPQAAATETSSAPAKPKRFSFIRVAQSTTEELAIRRPVIIEDAVSEEVKKEYEDVKARKKEDDEHLAMDRSAADILRELERDEAHGKRKGGFYFRDASGTSSDFRSTDYLRRERVYQIKKKKLSFHRASTKVSTVAAKNPTIVYHGPTSVEDLAQGLAVKVREVALKLDALGIDRPVESHDFADWLLDLEAVQLIAADFGFEVKDRSVSEDALVQVDDGFKDEPRPPVVTIMGHVDHGKTSLLDFIRRSRVVEKEAGGITQHIGAYTVKVSDAMKNIAASLEASQTGEASGKSKKSKAESASDSKKTEKAAGKKSKDKSDALAHAAAIIPEITFLDTPGHAAFSSMRARGAQVTDIVVLVVAATEGLMPQTREAIDHAKAAGVPLIVAINKMDLPEANPDRVLQQLSEVGVLSEEWGGEVLVSRISAKTGMGVSDLLEKIQLQSELLELKSRKEGPAGGIIIEAHLDKGRGSVATALIKEGTLRVSDLVVVGTQSSKVRALIDDQGKNIKEAGPSTPVMILGLTSVPEAGDPLNAVPDEKKAKELVDLRKKMSQESGAGRKMSLEEMMRLMNEGEVRELPIVLKADVKGSVEAISGALEKLPVDRVKVKVLSAAVGGISESDVVLASASKAIIIGFNVRPDAKTIAEAERLGVEIKTYNIIYNLIDDIVKALEGLLAPTIKEEVLGQAEVRNVFSLSKAGTVAGSFVVSGKMLRTSQIRVIRQGRVVYTGKMGGLKRFKDDAKEVTHGYECGISIENFNDIKVGDILECFKNTEVAAKLEGSSASA